MLLFSPPPNSVPERSTQRGVRVCGKQTSASFFSMVFLLIFCSVLVLAAAAHNKNTKENVKNDNTASERNIKIRLKLTVQNSTSSSINNFACNLKTIILSANTVYLY